MQSVHLLCNPIKEIEYIDRLSSLDAFGDHGERKQNDVRSRQADGWVSAALIPDCNPLHVELLDEGITQDDAHALKFVSLRWLEDVLREQCS